VLTSERSVLMQSWAAGAILMASLPMARTDLRTKSTSISVAYLCLVLVQVYAKMGVMFLLSKFCQHLLDVSLGCKHEDEL
jgi:hypothetical protein